jgi:transposase-like protein
LGTGCSLSPERGTRLGGRRPARARAAERITPEEFRERVAASVERRGQLNILEVARRLGFPAPKAREIAEALA